MKIVNFVFWLPFRIMATLFLLIVSPMFLVLDLIADEDNTKYAFKNIWGKRDNIY